MYSCDDSAASDREKLRVKQLETLLKGGKELSWGGIRFSSDRSVGFAPLGSYTFGMHTPYSLAKDGAIVARHGERGAELLGEVAEVTKNPPYSYGLVISGGRKPKRRVSVLGEVYGAFFLYGDGFGDGVGIVGFGVFETGGACCAKNPWGKQAVVEVKSASGFMLGKEYNIEVGEAYDEKYIPETRIAMVLSEIEQGGQLKPEIRELIMKRAKKQEKA